MPSDPVSRVPFNKSPSSEVIVTVLPFQPSPYESYILKLIQPSSKQAFVEPTPPVKSPNSQETSEGQEPSVTSTKTEVNPEQSIGY